jgi:hypothetical protein
MLELLISLIVGLWVGGVLSYFLVIRPLMNENDELRETVNKQQSKKFFNEFQLKQEEYE